MIEVRSVSPKIKHYQIGMSIKYGSKLALFEGMLNDFSAYQLAKQFYQICKTLKLPAHLKDQLCRIAEKQAKFSSKAEPSASLDTDCVLISFRTDTLDFDHCGLRASRASSLDCKEQSL